MRRTLILGLVALTMGLLSTACADQLIPVEPGREQISQAEGIRTITATLESDATKTALSGLNVVWKEGDAIIVYNSATPDGAVYSLSSGDGQSTATFTANAGGVSGSGPYYALYPADIASGNFSSLKLKIPGTQKYAESSFGAGANIAMAAGNNLENLQFQNLCGILKLTITGSNTISKINLYTRGTDVLQGTATIDDPLSAKLKLPSYNGTNGTITLDCGSGVALTSDGKDFYFVLPTGTMMDGFQAEIIDSEGKAMIKNAKAINSNMIIRSQIRPMPEFPYEQQYNKDFLTAVSEAGVWTGVLKNQTLAKVQEYTALEDGNGQYAYFDNGDGHTLRFQNWKAGYAVTMTTGSTLTLGDTEAKVTVSSKGNTTVADKTNLKVTVVKQFGGRSWLVDATGGNGYIIQ